MLSKNRKIYERAILLAAVIVLAGTVALAGITDSASAKARYLTVRCVCVGKTVNESSAAEDRLTFAKEAGAYPDSTIALDIVSEDGLKVCGIRQTVRCRQNKATKMPQAV